ncbi:MAG: DUF1552 domain-containing protein [Verrucomicrobiota bacterium]
MPASDSSRRRFLLQSLGASVALPWLPSLSTNALGATSPVQVAAGAGAGARRFVAVANLLGFQQKQFFPETAGRNYETTTLLKPLQENRDLMTIYRGMDHGVKGGHFAVHSYLSGVLHSEAQDLPTKNMTLDQYLAEIVGVQTRFPSLTLGSEGGIHGGCQLSWTRSGVRVPPITHPAVLFEKLFVSDSPERQKARVRQNHLQASILDSVRDDAKRLSTQVNQEDRHKLDEYLTSIRDVEKRLQLRRRWSHQPKPDAPFAKPPNTNTVEDLPMLYELMALALQTDSTRIATMEIGGCFLPKDLGINKGYHSLSHHGNDDESIGHLITLETYQLTHFNQFLSRLRSIPDGEGTLLDSTSVLFGSGMGNGHSHTNSDLPIVLAGGGFSHGSYKIADRKGANKVPLCNLFVTLAQRMGVETDSFGTSTGSYA